MVSRKPCGRRSAPLLPCMNLPIKLISTDFDGTFFAEFESPPVPLELQSLIGELQQQGAKWAINTGRDMSSLMETLGRADIPIEPDYLVLVERGNPPPRRIPVRQPC